MKRVSPGVLASWLCVTAMLLFSGPAWGHGETRLLSLSRVSGDSGTEVTVKGVQVQGEVRWNSADGPKLSDAILDANRAFSTQIVIPQVPPGVYFILVGTGASGSRAAFEVTGDTRNETGFPAADKAIAGPGWKSVSIDKGSGQASGTPPGGGMVGTGLVVAGLAGITGLGAMAVRRRSGR